MNTGTSGSVISISSAELRSIAATQREHHDRNDRRRGRPAADSGRSRPRAVDALNRWPPRPRRASAPSSAAGWCVAAAPTSASRSSDRTVRLRGARDLGSPRQIAPRPANAQRAARARPRASRAARRRRPARRSARCSVAWTRTSTAVTATPSADIHDEQAAAPPGPGAGGAGRAARTSGGAGPVVGCAHRRQPAVAADAARERRSTSSPGRAGSAAATSSATTDIDGQRVVGGCGACRR